MTCTCSSCARRAGWTPGERARFDAEDDRVFAVEAALRPFPGFAPELLESAPRLPARMRPVEDLTGRRFGRLLILGPEMVSKGGYARVSWRARCGCGAELVVRPDSLRRALGRGSTPQCRPCALAAVAARRPNARLSEADVRQIRVLRARSWTLRQLAARFGVSPAAAYDVVRGKTWGRAA